MAKTKLTPTMIQKLKQAQRDIHDVLPDLEKMEECGVECQTYRESLEQAQERINKLLTYFGPPVSQQ